MKLILIKKWIRKEYIDFCLTNLFILSLMVGLFFVFMWSSSQMKNIGAPKDHIYLNYTYEKTKDFINNNDVRYLDNKVALENGLYSDDLNFSYDGGNVLVYRDNGRYFFLEGVVNNNRVIDFVLTYTRVRAKSCKHILKESLNTGWSSFSLSDKVPDGLFYMDSDVIYFKDLNDKKIDTICNSENDYIVIRFMS